MLLKTNYLQISIELVVQIKLHYQSVSIAEKRKMIVSIYPKNLCFDGTGHRTPYVNQPLAFILQIVRCKKERRNAIF
ncbi:MAG: hypothetical protein ACTHNW_20835, partial [Mucilaginibacter sp.]